MIYDVLLGTAKSQIVNGLLNGEMVRWGGVVRMAKGMPGAGQVVGMLRDVPQIAQVANPLGAVLKAADVVVNVHGHHVTHSLVREGFAQTHKMLGQVMGIASVGAAASVLNLGVTAVGFYIMNKKLNQLQSSVSQLSEMTAAGFKRMDQQFASIQDQLLELRLVAYSHSQNLQDILVGVYDIKKALCAERMAELFVALKGLDRLKTQPHEIAERQRYLDELSKVRFSFQGELEARRLEVEDHPDRFLDTMMLFRGFCLAGASEVLAERQQGRIGPAADRAEELARQCRQCAGDWAEQLVPVKVDGGMARFGHSRLRESLGEPERRRLMRLHTGEDVSTDELRDLEVRASHEVALANPSSDWFEHQVRVANMLDMVEETTERMESLAIQTRYCVKERLGYQQWELLPEASEETVDSENSN